MILVFVLVSSSTRRLLLCFGACLLLLFAGLSFLILERTNDSFLGLESLSRDHVLAGQKIVVQTAALVNGTQGRGGQMEFHHFVQNLRVDSLHKNVWLEGSLGVFHGKGKVVSGPNVLSIVQSPARSVRPEASLFVIVGGNQLLLQTHAVRQGMRCTVCRYQGRGRNRGHETACGFSEQWIVACGLGEVAVHASSCCR